MEGNNKRTVEITGIECDNRDASYNEKVIKIIRSNECTAIPSLPPEALKKFQSRLQDASSIKFNNKDQYLDWMKFTLKALTKEEKFEMFVNNLFMEINEKLEKNSELFSKKVLVIYTGGTIGSAPVDPNDPDSPQIVKEWSELRSSVPQLNDLKFGIDAISFVEPLDSSKVGPQHWFKIAQIISDNYKNYNGFVILHGTDTMVYTSSALSFMLRNLNKPVIITGAQKTAINNVRSDAVQNIVTSLIIAAGEEKVPIIPEVCIFFHTQLLRGCRAKKADSSGYAGFNTPNLGVLGTAGDQIRIKQDLLLHNPGETAQLEEMKHPDSSVIALDIFPGIQEMNWFSEIINREDIKGIVLKTYGTGNTPTDDNFLNAIKKATDSGKVIINVTQCPSGFVEMGLYETSQVLLDRGVISGFDISSEAALCKLMYLFSRYEDINLIKEEAQLSLCGEQSLSMFSIKLDDAGSLSSDKDAHITQKVDLKSIKNEKELSDLKKDDIDKVIVRFNNVKLKVKQEGGDELVDLCQDKKTQMPNGKIVVKLYLNSTSVDNLEEETCVGTLKKQTAVSQFESIAADVSHDSNKDFICQEAKGRGAVLYLSYGIKLIEGAVLEWDSVQLDVFFK